MNFNKDTFVKILHLFLRSILWKTSLKHALNKFLWFLKGIYCCMSQNSQLTHWQTENFIACQYPWQFFVCTESLCFNQKVVPHILSSSFLKEWLYLDTKLNVVLRQQYAIILAVLGVGVIMAHCLLQEYIFYHVATNIMWYCCQKLHLVYIIETSILYKTKQSVEVVCTSSCTKWLKNTILKVHFVEFQLVTDLGSPIMDKQPIQMGCWSIVRLPSPSLPTA